DRQQLWQPGSKIADARTQRRHLATEIEPTSAQQPSRGVLDQCGDFDQHGRLDPRCDPVVERFDPCPQALKLEDFADDQVGAGGLCGGAAGPRLHVVDKGDTGAVDEVVGNGCGNNLPTQRVGCDAVTKAVAQCLWKITPQLVGELNGPREVGAEQFLV